MEKLKRKFLKKSDSIFDFLYKSLESSKGYRVISTVLILVFFSALALVFLNRNGAFSPEITALLADSYFFAVEIVFRILLAVEIITMVFVLAYSVSDSVAKQFEILSLILLRQAFKEFSYIELPLDFEQSYQPITYILSDIFGALLIYIGIYYFGKIQKHRKFTLTDDEQGKFISVKKLLANSMIVIFLSMASYDLIAFFTHDKTFDFFSYFYTVLIFTDILIVIFALRYSHSYCVVFRNTGYAVATILIRLSLSLPHYFDALLGLLAVLFAIIMSLFFNKFEIKRYRLMARDLFMPEKEEKNDEK